MEKQKTACPDWIVFHVPHASTYIPSDILPQFVLDEAGLEEELRLMTDHKTDVLFSKDLVHARVVSAEVSRLVVDAERFVDDRKEAMAKRGMGVVYAKTSQGKPLRRGLTDEERENLLARYYRPHHTRLTAQVSDCLDLYGKCLILDCHSFPHRPLPYEPNQGTIRSDICIGTDPFHTPMALESHFAETFSADGLKVTINNPFSGSIVPNAWYLRDKRVASIMIEVNRSLYLDESTSQLADDFDETARRITSLCLYAIDLWMSGEA